MKLFARNLGPFWTFLGPSRLFLGLESGSKTLVFGQQSYLFVFNLTQFGAFIHLFESFEAIFCNLWGLFWGLGQVLQNFWDLPIM